MDNGIYIAASRQLALFRDMEVAASNIANINTNGYQSEHMVFDKYLADNRVGTPLHLANDISTYRNTGQGNMQVTENALDLAISGDGYFMVQTPIGERYTRAGNFKINEQNQLITVEGYPVLDQGGQPIAFDEGGGSIEVNSRGTISTNGQELATIGLARFENEQLMQRHGAKYYSSDVQPQIDEISEIAQGVLETSNTQAVTQLTHIMKVTRAVGSTAKFIEVMYDLQRRNTTTWTQQR